MKKIKTKYSQNKSDAMDCMAMKYARVQRKKNFSKEMMCLKGIIIVTFLFISQLINAESISEQQANSVALNFLKSVTGRTGLKAVMNYKQIEPNGTIDFYVFNFLSFKGFVIVTADDNIEPVIAYSTESAFDLNGALNTGVSDWMNDVRKQIQEILKNNLKADERISGLWQAYLNGSQSQPPVSSAVAPLLTTQWDQSQNIAGFQFYNSMCPYDFDSSRHCPTGCTATAMAQIMKYWNQPTIGIGSHSYLHFKYGTLSANFGATVYGWANMPNVITSANDPHDVDLLMYHCGVSVDMNYAPNASGAPVIGPFWTAQYAYVNYFGYRNTIQGLYASNYTPTAWTNLLKAELDAKRPIQYVGYNKVLFADTGHTWVVDGYNAANQFHMNWGWGGWNDGNFSLTNLNPYVFNFNVNQGALIGIWPGTLSDCNANWNLTGTQSAEYSWQSSDYITSTMYIQNNVKSKYTAANQIILSPGFHADINSNFIGAIQPCITFRSMGPNSPIAADDKRNNFSVYPNPFSNRTTISYSLQNDKKVDLKIYNGQMQLVAHLLDQSEQTKGQHEVVFDANGLSAGIYFVKMNDGETNAFTKMVLTK